MPRRLTGKILVPADRPAVTAHSALFAGKSHRIVANVTESSNWMKNSKVC